MLIFNVIDLLRPFFFLPDLTQLLRSHDAHRRTRHMCSRYQQYAWRLAEGKHIAKLEITWQLPRQPRQSRSNQLQKQKKTLTPATNGETSKMAESKMAAPTPDTKTAEPALNVAMCTTPTGPPQGKTNPDFSGAASMCLWCLVALKIFKL